jgi:hypothetical protein
MQNAEIVSVSPPAGRIFMISDIRDPYNKLCFCSDFPKDRRHISKWNRKAGCVHSSMDSIHSDPVAIRSVPLAR